MSAFDYLLVGGEVINGTGNPGFRAAVGIGSGRITVLRGDTGSVSAKERIDVTGHVVAPGFIDAHSHSDLVLIEDPQLAAKVTQGVTTEVIGVDGISYAPFTRPADRDALMLQNGGIAGIVDGLPPWSTIGEQLSTYTGRTAVNVAAFVGNAPVRIDAVGWDERPATKSELDRMRGMVRDAMDDGALGLSTGLDYPPGAYADTDELVALATEAAARGGLYHTHVRYSLGDRYLDPFREAAAISRRSGAPLQITHFSRSARDRRSEGAQRMLDFVETERAQDLEVTFDTYPFEWGGTRLSRLLPAWVQAGHPALLSERLRDQKLRAQVCIDVDSSPAVLAYDLSRPFSDLRIGNLADESHRIYEGRYLSEVAEAMSMPLPEALIDLVLANPAATFTRPSPHAMTLWKFVCHPLGMIASDSVFLGMAASPRAFGTFTRVLGDFVREERLLSLPEAVRKMTSMPATVLGLHGRGIIDDGAHADIVVFDPATVGARATYESPRELSVGVKHVFVNGTAVLRDGRLTDATPGRGIRRQDR